MYATPGRVYVRCQERVQFGGHGPCSHVPDRPAVRVAGHHGSNKMHVGRIGLHGERSFYLPSRTAAEGWSFEPYSAARRMVSMRTSTGAAASRIFKSIVGKLSRVVVLVRIVEPDGIVIVAPRQRLRTADVVEMADKRRPGLDHENGRPVCPGSILKRLSLLYNKAN